MEKPTMFDDNYLLENISEAKKDKNKAFEVYKNYVGSSKTEEERIKRIHKFRCGGM
jgi:hypothetical protein